MDNSNYVSSEVAKTLKESGFNMKCDHYWYKVFDNQNTMDIRQSSPDNFNRDDWSVPHYSAPTLYQAQKWLREVHGLHISISAVIGGRWTYKLQDLWQKSDMDEEYNTRIPERDGYPCIDTYEAALHTGIKSALELINDNGNSILL